MALSRLGRRGTFTTSAELCPCRVGHLAQLSRVRGVRCIPAHRARPGRARPPERGGGFLRPCCGGGTRILRRLVQLPTGRIEMNTLFEKLKRSEEHTSELQSRGHLVCRLLLEK